MFIITMALGKITPDKKKPTDKKMTDNLVRLSQTEEAKKLIKTKEFRNLFITPEFQTIAIDFGKDKLITILKM